MSKQPATGKSYPRQHDGIIAAGLLLVALAVVVFYTSRSAFFSPLALVVVAAIGVAALLLQRRLQPQVPGDHAIRRRRSPLWLNGLGVVFAVVAVVADVLHPGAIWVSAAALAAVVSFALSGLLVLSAMRKDRG